ncbi:P27 family phage terminase small subunit [Candidatus Thiothrix sp. Deng01]|uniref:P27 family phage terminase small subunit n=1 Tax=Candidatus Thiothrix phosphatis TaxID=3112415 RepID=A0ABU6D1T9_9GAMM|nr:P27 family phage terminase small subunit [Candidatus Thiothrix sp. Deng01]MEB4592339.1 P27 family phage terminase small subunit [Candidatus Thiothrix sp. Deng01]
MTKAKSQPQQAAAARKPFAPQGTPQERKLWNRYAILLADQNRYHSGFAEPLMELVRAQLLLRRLDEELEKIPSDQLFYSVVGRNGEQRKAAPEILAVQQARRQFLQFAGAFGLSPVANSKIPAADTTPDSEFDDL